MNEIGEIKGHTVLLRPLNESDIEASLQLWTPELRHMYGGSLTAPAADIEARRAGKLAWLARIRSGEEGHTFAVEVAGRYIGHAAIDISDAENRKGRFRIGIEDSSVWGKGYGTEVAELMLRFGFEQLDLHRIQLRVAAYNARAIRCYEKAGFRREGAERHSFFVDGKWHDDLLMATLRDEWRALHNPPADGLCSVGPEHIDEVLALWEQTELWPHENEDRGLILDALARNRNFAVGWRVAGRLVATTIGASEGFRGWLWRVAVLPEYQRKGIASALIAEVEKRLFAAGLRQINAQVYIPNTNAQAFYENIGYEPTQAHIMRKRTIAQKGAPS